MLRKKPSLSGSSERFLPGGNLYWSVKTTRLLEASDLLGWDSIMDSDSKIMSKIVIKGWVSCSLTLSCKKFSKPRRETERRLAVQDVEESYFLRFKTSYVIFTSTSLCSNGDNSLICFIVPWRTGLRLPMYKCIGAGYTITLRKSKVNKVTEPCEKLLQKQIGYSFKRGCGGGGWGWRKEVIS